MFDKNIKPVFVREFTFNHKFAKYLSLPHSHVCLLIVRVCDRRGMFRIPKHKVVNTLSWVGSVFIIVLSALCLLLRFGK